jgi:beta-glucanase (GH16 family)
MRHLPFSVFLIFIFSSCHLFSQGDISPFENSRTFGIAYFKKKWSFRNRTHKIKYSFNKKPKSLPIDFFVKNNLTLTFFDDFDSLNTQKWRLGQPWGEIHPSNLHQYYSAEAVRVDSGFLYLGGMHQPKNIVHQEKLITVPYAIGLINSDISFKQKYGYFEIRSKNPQGAATWPAFWLTGSTKWPPEIDIFEMYGRKIGKHIHNQYVSLHYGKSNTKSRGFLSHKVQLKRNTDQEFHIYGCLWTPEYLKFYTDGRLVLSIKINKKLRAWLDEEMVVIINNCFEEKYLKYLPENFTENQFVVDWIRVYAFNPKPTN